MHKLILFSVLIFLGASCQVKQVQQIEPIMSEIRSVKIGSVSYVVEVKDTPEKRRQGLSGRESLNADEGMLFLFDEPAPLSFWMKDMQFPLDFLWIKDGIVIGINENVPHPVKNDGQIARLSSPEPADAVLELNAGQIQLHGLKIGDLVKYGE